MPFGVIWNDDLGVWKCWEKMKIMMLNGTFWHNLKQGFGSWNCKENWNQGC